MSVIRKVQVRRGTAAAWSSANPVLSSGEFGYDETNDKVKIGDGATAWNSLPFAHYKPSEVDDILEDYLNTTDTTIDGVLIGRAGVVRAATYDEVMPVVIQGINGSVPANPAGRYCHKTDYVNLATTGGTQYVNIVQTWGYNYDRANLAEPRCGFTIESNYALNNVGPYIFEAHIQAIYVDGFNYRPLHVNLPKTQAEKDFASVEWRTQVHAFNDYDGNPLLRLDDITGVATIYLPLVASNTTFRANNLTVPEIRNTNKTLVAGDHLIATDSGSTRLFILPNNPVVGQIARITSAGGPIEVYPFPTRANANIRSGSNSITLGGNYSGHIKMAAYSSLEFVAVNSDLWVVIGGTPGATHVWV